MKMRTAGIFGLMGAIVLFVGDIVLFGHLGSAADFWEGTSAVAEQASDARLFAGGLLGIAGAFLYIAGFWHIYLNTRRAGLFAAKVLLGGLCAMMVGGGAYHVVWAVRMFCFKHGLVDIHGLAPFVETIESYINAVFITSAIPGFLVSPILAVLVLTGRSSYPRWTVIANPALLVLLRIVGLLLLIPGPFGAMIYGGCINLSFLIFFTVSVSTTWREGSVS